MKAAYFAYDRNSLAALPVLSNYFEHIDFFIVEDTRPAEVVHFNDVSLITDTLHVPGEQALRTLAHEKIVKSIQKEFNFYKKQLMFENKKSVATYTEVQKKIPTEVNPISQIKDVVFNPKSNDMYIERAKTGVSSPYNAVFVENHQIVAEQFAAFGKNIFKQTPVNTHIWFSAEFTFELKKPREKNLGARNFILVKDRLNRSVLDNWYFVRTRENKITVQQWVPINQVKNSDFQKFMIERVDRLLKEKLDVIQVTEFNQMYVNATPGFSENATVLRHGKISTLMPSFNFWTQENVNHFLFSALDTKMKALNKLKMTQLAARGPQ